VVSIYYSKRTLFTYLLLTSYDIDIDVAIVNIVFFSALTLLVGSFDPYNVFGGTLNLNQSIH